MVNSLKLQDFWRRLQSSVSETCFEMQIISNLGLQNVQRLLLQLEILLNG